MRFKESLAEMNLKLRLVIILPILVYLAGCVTVHHEVYVHVYDNVIEVDISPSGVNLNNGNGRPVPPWSPPGPSN